MQQIVQSKASISYLNFPTYIIGNPARQRTSSNFMLSSTLVKTRRFQATGSSSTSSLPIRVILFIGKLYRFYFS